MRKRKVLKYTSENKSAWHLLVNKSPCELIKKTPKQPEMVGYHNWFHCFHLKSASR